jgi:hypothetical protein
MGNKYYCDVFDTYEPNYELTVFYYETKYPKTYNNNNISNIRHFSTNTPSTDLDEKTHIKPIKTYSSSNKFSYTEEDKKLIYKENKNKSGMYR